MTSCKGSCHCGRVEFVATTALDSTFRCNCSFCVRRGATLQKVPTQAFAIQRGEAALTRYGSRDFSDHYFCSVCGIHLFTRIRRANESSVAVNVACLDHVDLSALSPTHFDGKSRL